MSNWLQRVSSDARFSPPFSDERQAQVYAVYELCLASDAGGLVSYFTFEAAAHFNEVVAWLEGNNIAHGWVSLVRDAFGGGIPQETDERIARLSVGDEWSAGIDPFQEAQALFDEARSQLDDAMDRFLETLSGDPDDSDKEGQSPLLDGSY